VVELEWGQPGEAVAGLGNRTTEAGTAVGSSVRNVPRSPGGRTVTSHAQAADERVSVTEAARTLKIGRFTVYGQGPGRRCGAAS